MSPEQYSDDEKRRIIKRARREGVPQTAKYERPSASTIYGWMQEPRHARPKKAKSKKGTKTSTRTESYPEPPPTRLNRDPKYELPKAMDEAAAAFAQQRRTWLPTGWWRRVAAKRFDRRISKWERAHGRANPEDKRRIQTGLRRAKQPAPHEGKNRHVKPSRSQSVKNRKVYVFDSGPIAALADNEAHAWTFLREIHDENHEMVVPTAVIDQVLATTKKNKYLRSVLKSRYIKKIGPR